MARGVQCARFIERLVRHTFTKTDFLDEQSYLEEHQVARIYGKFILCY